MRVGESMLAIRQIDQLIFSENWQAPSYVRCRGEREGARSIWAASSPCSPPRVGQTRILPEKTARREGKHIYHTLQEARPKEKHTARRQKANAETFCARETTTTKMAAPPRPDEGQ